MSSGRKFATLDLEEKTPEERIEILEQKLPVLIERIQVYDNIVRENDILKGKLIGIQQVVDELKKLLNSSASMMLDHKKNLDVSINDLKKSQEQFQRNDMVHSKNHEELSNMLKMHIKSHDDSLAEIDKCITKISSHAVDSQDFSNLKENLKIFLSRIDNDIIALSSLQQKDQSKIESIPNLDKKFSEEVTGLKIYIGKLNDKVETIKAEGSKSIDGILSKLNGLPPQIADHVSSLLEEAKNEMMPKGASLKDVRNEFYIKLDGFKMDLSNAMLKASVNTQQLAALEKKSEQIYLLLKKYDLDKLV